MSRKVNNLIISSIITVRDSPYACKSLINYSDPLISSASKKQII